MGCFSTEVKAPDPINPAQVGAESLQTQLNLAPQVLAATQQYAQPYANLYNQTQQGLLFGTHYFNADQALQGDPWVIANRSQIEANAAQQGISPQEWLTRHVNESASSGDAGMQKILQQYGGTSNNGAIGLYQQAVPAIQKIQSQANTAQRQADINDVANLGSQAVAAYKAANPELAATMSSLAGKINGAAAPQVNVSPAQAALMQAQAANGGPLLGQLEQDASANLGKVSGIQNTLNRQAQSLLSTNGALSADEINRITQQTRAAAAARGIYDGNSALAAEAMNTESARRNRLLENMQIAQGVDTSGQNQLNAGRSYAAAVQGQGQNLSQFNTGQANQASAANAQAQNAMNQFNAQLAYQQQLANAGLSQQALQNQFTLAGVQQGQSHDPFQLVLGRSGAVNQVGGIAGQAAGANTGAPSFDPFDSSIMGILQGNQANQLAANTATANNNSSLLGAGLGLFGDLGGATIGAAGKAGGFGKLFCWVAREVYGKHNPRWLVFRAWLMRSPHLGLRWFYGRYGERFAAFIHDKPRTKAVIRFLMDLVVEPRMPAHAQPA